MSSSNGIARNRDSLSIELSYCATECSSNPAIWPRAQSTYGWLRFGDWRTRLPMLVYSAPSLLLVYVALRVQRSSVSGLEIGYPQVRPALCGNLPTLKRSKASATARLLPSCSAVVFDGGSWPTSLSITSSVARIIGQSWISLEKAVTFALSQFPNWVKQFLDEWFAAAEIANGKLFRCVCRSGRVWGDGMTEKVVWHVVKTYGKKLEIPKLAPHDLRRSCAQFCHAAAGELEQIQFLLGHVSVQTTERYLGCKQKFREAVNDRIGIEPAS